MPQLSSSDSSINFHRYQRIATIYDLLDLPFEYGRYRALRRQLFDGLQGRILDAGVGTGRNFPFYPRNAEVMGIDISPAMLRRAKRRRSRSPAQSIELRQMDVTHMALPDRAFDAAVTSFLFCVLPDELQIPALRELHRVVRPGGVVRLMEYVRPQSRIRHLITRLWDPWIAWAYGASFDRQTEMHIRNAGLKVSMTRFVVTDLIKLIEIEC